MKKNKRIEDYYEKYLPSEVKKELDKNLEELSNSQEKEINKKNKTVSKLIKNNLDIDFVIEMI